MHVGVLEAKNSLSQLLKRVVEGEDVVITNRGQPVARLVPTAEASPVASRRRLIAELRAQDIANPKPESERLSWEQIKALRDKGRP